MTLDANVDNRVRRLSSLGFNTINAEKEQQKQWTRDLLQRNLSRLLSRHHRLKNTEIIGW